MFSIIVEVNKQKWSQKWQKTATVNTLESKNEAKMHFTCTSAVLAMLGTFKFGNNDGRFAHTGQDDTSQALQIHFVIIPRCR